MTLSRRTAAGLLAAGAWTVFNWVTFARNFDPTGRSTGFVVVHMSLVVVNSALGLWLASLGWRALRRAPAVPAAAEEQPARSPLSAR